MDKKKFEFLLFDKEIIRVGFLAYCPRQIRGSFLINNELVGEFKLIDKKWTELAFTLKKRNMGNIICTIELNSTWIPQKDNRKLGLLIKEIYFESKNQNKRKLNMEHDLDYFMKSCPNRFVFDSWHNQAMERPRIYNYIQMAAKGPISIDLVKFLRTNAKNFDIILANMIPFNTISYALSAAKRTQLPLVLLPHFHINDKTHYWRYFFEAFEKADVVLVLTEIAKQLLETRSINAKVVGAGIDFHELNNPSISGKRFRSRYKLENTFLVLFVGRKTQYKRYEMVVSAINILRNKGFNAKLVIIGPDEDKKTIESEGTLYLGKVERDIVLDAIDACDVFAMPSENESFGIVFCEAWSRKKPVIGNGRCGPVSCLIEHEKDGFLCDDAKGLAEYITRLIVDPCLGRSMGENGYTKVMNNYTWDVVAERVKEIYEKLL
jgi:glycosyltransferase involved in cell wall biosynthesis